MRRLTVLSPHRDDAAFSLFIALSKWSALPLHVKIINFFTVSAYGPHADSDASGVVSSIRRVEDRRVLGRIDSAMEVADETFLDAPLRLGIAPSAVCNSETRTLLSNDLVEKLSTLIRLRGSQVALAPLALGNHVDHLAVHSAALQIDRARRLGFYEDLPYATWTAERDLRQRVSDAEDTLKLRLRSVIVRGDGAFAKRRSIAQYRSQITAEEANEIGRWAKQFGGGERIWIPCEAKHWDFVI